VGFFLDCWDIDIVANVRAFIRERANQSSVFVKNTCLNDLKGGYYRKWANELYL
jgi:hypothetical protein